MGDRILEIVVHLMDHLRDHHGEFGEMDDLVLELKGLGYTDGEISSAYSWVMERFDITDNTYYSQFPDQHHSNRILTHYERYQLTTEAYGFLIKLLHHELIDDEQFESVLERSTLFSPKPVTIDQVKLIASAVVFREITDIESLGWFDNRVDLPQQIN